MRNSHRSLRKDKRAASPAISTVILTGRRRRHDFGRDDLRKQHLEPEDG